MSRAVLLIANLVLLAAALGAGWFAINAPQLARPTLAPLGEVQLASEEPPTPRTPVVRTAGEAREHLARRSLFYAPDGPDGEVTVAERVPIPSQTAPAASAEDRGGQDGVVESERVGPAEGAVAVAPEATAAGAPEDLAAPEAAATEVVAAEVVAARASAPMRDVRAESPIARTVIDALPAPSINPPRMDAAYRSPIDGLRLVLERRQPKVDQFFSWKSMDYEARRHHDGPPAEPPSEIDGAAGERVASVDAGGPTTAGQTADQRFQAIEDLSEADGAALDAVAALGDTAEPPAATGTIETEAAETEAAEPAAAEVGAVETAADPSTLVGDAAAPETGVAPESAFRPQRRPGADGAEATPALALGETLDGEALLSNAPRPSRRAETTADQTRRVEAAATTRVDTIERAESGMILLGVFTGRGRARALVRTATGAVRVELGDEVDGWRVSAINDDSVQLRRASQTRLLKIPGSDG